MQTEYFRKRQNLDTIKSTEIFSYRVRFRQLLTRQRLRYLPTLSVGAGVSNWMQLCEFTHLHSSLQREFRSYHVPEHVIACMLAIFHWYTLSMIVETELGDGTKISELH